MPTIDSKRIIDDIIRHNGVYGGEVAPDNLPAVRIVEYRNAWGSVTWGVVFEGERDIDRYNRPSDYVCEPRTIWERKD